MDILPETDNRDNSGGHDPKDFSDGFDFAGFFDNIRSKLPYVLGEGGLARYILLSELPDDLEQWLATGRTEESTFRALPGDKEREFESMCHSFGFTVTRGSQAVEYMGHTTQIEYLRAGDPATGASVALIPWFMVPRKRYPAFVYIYACWYRACRHKGVRESAGAAGAVFGVGIHYSTASRSMAMAQAILEAGEPMPAEAPETGAAAAGFGGILDSVPGLLAAAADSALEAPAAESQAGAPGNGRAAALPDFPSSLAEVVRAGEQARARNQGPPPPGAHSRRKQKAGPPAGDGPAKPGPFLSREKLGGIRRQFIALCKGLILDAATRYHKFLL
jgi:hypothetical protein